LLPAAAIAMIGEASWETSCPISIPADPIWDSVKNEIELCTVHAPGGFKGQFKLMFHITFGEIEGISGRNVGQVLEGFLKTVKVIVDSLEGEAVRLGIVK
jgi:hypothetical protein